MKTTYKMHTVICPECKYVDSPKLAFGKKRELKAKDLWFCLACGKLFEFQEDFTLKLMTEEQIKDLSVQHQNMISDAMKAHLELKARGDLDNLPRSA